MFPELRSRVHKPSPAMVVALLALFVALSGTALASVIITSNSQVASNTISGHKPPTGYHANIVAGSVNGQDVANNSLTGAKIVKNSGVETCTSAATSKFGRICAGSDGTARTLAAAMDHCAGLGLRVPSFSEAVTLAENYDVPGVGTGQFFWTDDFYFNGTSNAVLVDEAGASGSDLVSNTYQTVCVTEPSN
jgi:hypothetical protein